MLVSRSRTTSLKVFRVEGLSKSYGPRWALRDAAFAVRPGEIVGIIGPNGSGKTTLLTGTAGVLAMSAGCVYVDDAEASRESLKHALFFLPENARPWPDQSVGWVISFVAATFERTAAESARIIADLRLDSLTASVMRTLSKGEHRRALIAMGLLSRRPLLILDEPFDGLDLRQTRDAMRVLRAEADGGRALVLSIHQLEFAAQICDRVVLLNNGAVVAQGTVDELRARAGLEYGNVEDIFLALT